MSELYTDDNPPPCPECGEPLRQAENQDYWPLKEDGSPDWDRQMTDEELANTPEAWVWGCDSCGVDYPEFPAPPHPAGYVAPPEPAPAPDYQAALPLDESA